MTESDAVEGIRRAAKRPERADLLRGEAIQELRERCREAQQEVSSGGLRPAGGDTTFLTIRSERLASRDRDAVAWLRRLRRPIALRSLGHTFRLPRQEVATGGLSNDR
jgi:hypothetical protein